MESGVQYVMMDGDDVKQWWSVMHLVLEEKVRLLITVFELVHIGVCV